VKISLTALWPLPNYTAWLWANVCPESVHKIGWLIGWSITALSAQTGYIVPWAYKITGCAVAQHCYNGDVSFLWEKWKL